MRVSMKAALLESDNRRLNPYEKVWLCKRSLFERIIIKHLKQMIGICGIPSHIPPNFSPA